ncbi:hypothetical protein KEU06_08055 [Pseudaminobacter sp. 19-2017]|uniref:Type I secretion protein n=1 Tax=Pseudaminobacter soli (ex Zhang et al. 2022) TaxID=2831468 RepID=A0A942E050_9HYPH|nr:hypothetical protein [Pseudaminobacter soli]MBS3648581.1 hypothetical protein [Pseudaminobacter soli]
MLLDRATEAIAHFIGLFSNTVEEARQREAFEQFTAAKGDPGSLKPLPNVELALSVAYEFEGFDPGLVYRPVAPDIISWTNWSSVDFNSQGLSLRPISVQPEFAHAGRSVASLSAKQATVEIEPLGSVANYLHQGIALADNDYFGVGGHGLTFAPQPAGDGNVFKLLDASSSLSPIPDPGMPGNAMALAKFATETAQALNDFNQDMIAGHIGELDGLTAQNTLIEKAESLEGTFVNGRADEAPDLEDYFSLEARREAGPHPEEAFKPNVTITDDGVKIDASVTLDTGSDVLINNAVLKNMWTASTVTAVVGDHIEINAIIQMNAWTDSDMVPAALGGWNKSLAETMAFNIGIFERIENSADKDEPDAEVSKSFPKYWAVTEVTGDLMIVNWLEQITFMKDNDIGILSSSGATSFVYSGSNSAFNSTSIYELGIGYDLIVVGGSVYDVNLIQQVNILSDNDVIGAVPGFETTGEGAYSTSGNLLWNQAQIYNVGTGGPYEALPADYQETADKLAAGKQDIEDGVLSDDAFAGQTALRVLHIEGDLVNFQYVKQTNILGDEDQIALAMHESGAYSDAKWSVTTGNNALINNAAIVDLDSLGKTYVGGDQYSQDFLFQADIIQQDPAFAKQNPDALINEAVAFLDDSMTADADVGDYYTAGRLDPDNMHGDPLASLIG